MKTRAKIKRLELFWLFLKVPVDLSMIMTGLILAYQIRLNYGEVLGAFMPQSEYLQTALYILPAWLLIFALNGLYTRQPQGLLSELNKTGTAVSVVFMLILALLFATRTLFFSRLLMLYAWLFCILFMALGRILMWLLRKLAHRSNLGVKKVIIVGGSSTAQKLAVAFQGFQDFRVIGFLDIFNESKSKKILDLPKFENFSQLSNKVDLDEVSELIWTSKGLDSEVAVKLAQYCRDEKISFRYVPNLFETQTINLEVNTVSGIPIVDIKSTPLEGWGRIVKRIVDVFGALVGLIVLSPIFALISIAIRLESKGPVYFKQKRVGENSDFWMYKFRSMVNDAHKMLSKIRRDKGDTGPFINVKTDDDPRLTSMGRFLRKISLDEMPQLYNVLRGEMSLVGPRPLAVQESKDVEKLEQRYRIRRYVKPGLTGLWQVSGRSDMTDEERIRLDIYYAENWSLVMDIQIILKTIWSVFVGKGAY